MQEAALKFLEDGDHDQLTNLLAEVCPVDDENSNALDAAEARFPLPEDHWINAPFGSDQKFATLLEMTIGQGKTWAVRLATFKTYLMVNQPRASNGYKCMSFDTVPF